MRVKRVQEQLHILPTLFARGVPRVYFTGPYGSSTRLMNWPITTRVVTKRYINNIEYCCLFVFQVCTHITRCYTVAAQFEECREKITEMPSIIKDLCRVLYHRVCWFQ